MQDLIDKFNKLSSVQKTSIFGGLLLLMVIFYFWFWYLPKQNLIKEEEKRLSQTQIDLAEKKAIADNLPQFEQEVNRLDEELQKQLKKLPNQAEIPKILRTISNLGKKAGLEFTLFSPGNDIARDFYAEVPLRISVLGSYHQLAIFFDKISQLNRIVNVENISLKNPQPKGGKMQLTTDATLVTYRFLDQAGAAPASGAK